MRVDVVFSEISNEFKPSFGEMSNEFVPDFGETTVLHDGQNGATFTPYVSTDGVISWINDRELPNPEPVNIKGDEGEDGATFTPDVSADGTLSWSNDKGLPNPPSVNIKGEDGYTPRKNVDYFDGKDGQDGKDGYTPQKNVDYFDGKDGYTPIKYKDYFDGEDGTPCTHRWSGTTLYVTSASGTSSANLKGEPGDKGDPGPAYTLTSADKAEMVNAVIAALPKYNGEVTSV